jgi:WD40 repeat protein
MAFSIGLNAAGEYVLPPGIVPFPRGFAFGRDGRLFLASGTGPHGEGDDTILVCDVKEPIQVSRLVVDSELSPLDLTIAPNGNIVVSSEYPFGASDATTTIREYDATDGQLLRVFSGNPMTQFQKPRGLRFAPDGRLCCVARDEVVAFDFSNGEYLGTIAKLPRLNGQALAFFP